MPGTYTYPGVYVEEVPSGVHPIAGVSTSDTAFVDFFTRGPMSTPTRVTSFDEFERRFGGLHAKSESSYSIQHYFLNGGSAAWIVRVSSPATGTNAAAASSFTLKSGTTNILDVTANSPGSWGDRVQAGVDTTGVASGFFNLYLREVVTNPDGTKRIAAAETHANVTMDSANAARYAVNVVNSQSQLVTVARQSAASNNAAPDATSTNPITPAVLANAADATAFKVLTGGKDGDVPDGTALGNGINSLDTIAPFVFNLLCLPRATKLSSDANIKAAYDAAVSYCRKRRAFVLIDPPESATTASSMSGTPAWMPASDPNAAVYWPRLTAPDPLQGGLPKNVGPSGAVAGVFARTDATRGVWKAPAGTEAVVVGGTLAVQVNDEEQGNLNVLGVNVLRTFPVYGNVVWGSRTRRGADVQASEWKYVPVRRMALYIEESLYQGLKWVVFEPNDEPLWAQIRLNVGSFMHQLYRQGAFAGATPRDAYLVKCDKDTTTQADVDRGIVNILVGFLPLKPAEFVVLRIQQLAGQIET